jgi:hypothetical protein
LSKIGIAVVGGMVCECETFGLGLALAVAVGFAL